MAWNHRAAIVAMGVTVQPELDVFVQPGVNDLMAVSNINNTREAITTDDPTATGTVWKPPRLILGKVGTVGATFPFRGPGGAAPPALGAFPFGRIMQSAGWAEIRLAAQIQANLVAGSTTTALRLDAAQNAADDFWIGGAIQHAAIGAGAVGGTSLIVDYVGATKDAVLAEELALAPAAGTQFTIPPQINWVQGTLTTPPPLLSVSVWRDRRRYDYMNCRPTSLVPDIPVGNEYQTGFPACEFALRGKLAGWAQEAAPQVPAAVRAIPILPAQGGKFLLDRTVLGHGGIRFTQGMDLGAPSNQNQAEGLDGYEIMTGDRTLALDMNQADLEDFDFEAREDSQILMPVMSTWGGGAGNRWGFSMPGIVIDPLNPGERNGFVSLTGDSYPLALDKAASLTLWW